MRRYRVTDGKDFTLAKWDPAETSAFDGGKADARASLAPERHPSSRPVGTFTTISSVSSAIPGFLPVFGRLLSQPMSRLLPAIWVDGFDRFAGHPERVAQPHGQRIRHLVDRLVFGSRDDPIAVVQHIVDQVGETDTDDDLLAALVCSLEPEDHDTALTALSDGASGYLVRGTDPERLEHALRAAAAGDVVLDHDMAQAVTELAMARRRAAASRPFAELTEREFHILDLVAQGLDNQAIARRLVLSPKTVRNHGPTSSPSSTLRTVPTPSCSAGSAASDEDPDDPQPENWLASAVVTVSRWRLQRWWFRSSHWWFRLSRTGDR